MLSLNAYWILGRIAISTTGRLPAGNGCRREARWPGYVAADLNDRRGYRTVEQDAKQAVKMALIGPDGPTGTFTDEDGTAPW